MGSPITWQNVASTSNADAMKGMFYASHSLNQAVDGISEIFKRKEAINAANHIQSQNNAYAAQIAKLRSYASPEALAEAQRTNAFDAASAAMLGAENATKFQAELANAPAKLMQQRIAQDQYNEHTLSQEQKPLVEAYHTALSNRDYKAAGSLLDANSVVGEAALREKLTLTMRQAEQDARQKRQDAQSSAEHGARMRQYEKANVADSLLNSTLGQFNKDNLAYRTNTAKVAKELGIPVNQAGNPELYGLNENTLKAYQARVGTAPNPVDYEQGLIQGAVTNGIAGSAGALTKAFTDAANGVNKGGKDDPALVRAIEMIDARKELARKQNIFYADPQTEDKIKADVVKQFADMEGIHFLYDKPDAAVAKILQDGLTYTNSNGKEVTVPITGKLAQLALRATSIDKKTIWKNWWEPNATVDFRKNLENLLKNPAYQAQLADLENLTTGASFTAEAKKLRQQFRAMNPQELQEDLAANLDKASAKALEEQNKAVSGGK